MASIAEERVSRLLRGILANLPNGQSVPITDELRETFVALQYFIPEVLGGIHREWKFEGLDDVVGLVARKTRQDEVELLGMCCIVTDQSVLPLHLRLQVAESSDEISWLECRLGEVGPGPHGAVRQPYEQFNSIASRLYALREPVHQIEWAYQVTYGARRDSMAD